VAEVKVGCPRFGKPTSTTSKLKRLASHNMEKQWGGCIYLVDQILQKLNVITFTEIHKKFDFDVGIIN